MNFALSKEETAIITKKFGKEFLGDVHAFLSSYSKKWDFEIIKMLTDLSINCLFKGLSPLYGDVILKLYRSDLRGFSTEAATLSEYNGFRFCRLIKSDIENGILLLEGIEPGTTLKCEPSLEKRLDVFLSLYNELHKEPQNSQAFPTYMQWVKKATTNLQEKSDYKDIYVYMLKASEICSELTLQYPQQLLLHGDFHFENILLDGEGDYRIIDPKGVLGHPIFDLPRYLLNEYWLIKKAVHDANERLKMMYDIIGYFGNTLGIPQEAIRKSFFIETAMANAWLIESGSEPRADDIAFAQKLMNC